MSDSKVNNTNFNWSVGNITTSNGGFRSHFDVKTNINGTAKKFGSNSTDVAAFIHQFNILEDKHDVPCYHKIQSLIQKWTKIAGLDAEENVLLDKIEGKAVHVLEHFRTPIGRCHLNTGELYTDSKNGCVRIWARTWYEHPLVYAKDTWKESNKLWSIIKEKYPDLETDKRQYAQAMITLTQQYGISTPSGLVCYTTSIRI